MIKLENGEALLNRYAESKHLITRRQNITDNALKISSAAYDDIQRLDKLIKTIEKNNLANAGDAMRYLGHDIDSSPVAFDEDINDEE